MAIDIHLDPDWFINILSIPNSVVICEKREPGFLAAARSDSGAPCHRSVRGGSGFLHRPNRAADDSDRLPGVTRRSAMDSQRLWIELRRLPLAERARLRHLRPEDLVRDGAGCVLSVLAGRRHGCFGADPDSIESRAGNRSSPCFCDGSCHDCKGLFAAWKAEPGPRNIHRGRGLRVLGRHRAGRLPDRGPWMEMDLLRQCPDWNRYVRACDQVPS